MKEEENTDKKLASGNVRQCRGFFVKNLEDKENPTAKSEMVLETSFSLFWERWKGIKDCI